MSELIPQIQALSPREAGGVFNRLLQAAGRQPQSEVQRFGALTITTNDQGQVVIPAGPHNHQGPGASIAALNQMIGGEGVIERFGPAPGSFHTRGGGNSTVLTMSSEQFNSLVPQLQEALTAGPQTYFRHSRGVSPNV